MNRTRAARCSFLAAMLPAMCLALAAPRARAVDMRDLVEEALDQPAEGVHIEALPIGEALAKLGEKTGLRFELDDQAIAWMPYGENTRVSLAFSGLSVRQGLRQVLDGLGLAFEVAGDKVRVIPGPVLVRLGRRLAIEEVRTLQQLATHQWSNLDEKWRQLQFRGIKAPDAASTLETAVAGVIAANAVRQLEAATQNLDWLWAPLDTSILVYSKAEDVWSRLQRPISLNYHGLRLDDLLIDLGERIGVTVMFEAGVLERIQADNRAVDLVHQNTTVLQTLERICGATHTCFEVQDYGVLIAMPVDTERPGLRSPPAPPAESRIVAILRVPVGDDGTTVDFPFYEDNVPPEFRRLLDQKLPVVINELQRADKD
jgi:hypothetical protein